MSGCSSTCRCFATRPAFSISHSTRGPCLRGSLVAPAARRRPTSGRSRPRRSKGNSGISGKRWRNSPAGWPARRSPTSSTFRMCCSSALPGRSARRRGHGSCAASRGRTCSSTRSPSRSARGSTTCSASGLPMWTDLWPSIASTRASWGAGSACRPNGSLSFRMALTWPHFRRRPPTSPRVAGSAAAHSSWAFWPAAARRKGSINSCGLCRS